MLFSRNENPRLTEIHVAEGNFIQFIKRYSKDFCFPNYPDIHFTGDNEVCGKCFNWSYFNLSPSMWQNAIHKILHQVFYWCKNVIPQNIMHALRWVSKIKKP